MKDTSVVVANTIIPKIMRKVEEKSGWTIYFYEDLAEFFLDSSGEIESSSIFAEFAHILDGKFHDFRAEFHLKSVPFLVAFFMNEKEIRFASPRLNQELFLLQEIKEHDSSYEELRAHTEKISSLNFNDFPTQYELVTHKNGLVDLVSDHRFEEIEKENQKLVRELLVHMNSYKSTIFEKMTDLGLGWTAGYALLRIHLLKFLAILPSLEHDRSGKEVKRILLESLRRLIRDSIKAKLLSKKGQERPLPSKGLLFIRISYALAYIIPANALALSVRHLTKLMAKRFIAGETIESANETLRSLSRTHREATLDQLGELVVSEREADHYMNEVIKIIKGLAMHIPRGEKNKAGINKAHVSIKVSALSSSFKPHAPDFTYDRVAPRLRKILIAAKEDQVFLNIDAEHYDYRDIVFKIYRRVLLETPELHDYEATGIVLQAYLRDASEHLDEIIALAKERGHSMPVRIVKGAYWDAETVQADAQSFDAPEFLNKEETDLLFRQLVIKIFQNHPQLRLALASHNFADHSFAEVVRAKMFQETPRIEHQCLHMTYEALSVAMARMGWSVRNYVPIGSLLVGMAYLVRRIMENSSQVGVLTIMRSHKKKQSLVSPGEVHREKKREGKIVRDLTTTHLTTRFFNISPLRLWIDRERASITNSLEEFKKIEMGKTFGEKFSDGKETTIVASSDPSLVVGKISFAGKDSTLAAIEKLDHAYVSGSWPELPWINRSGTLVKAARLMSIRRNEFSSLIVYEAGKSVAEALADVDEAIDFLNYYAREEGRAQKENPNLISRGVIAVIAPWNFPLAIPCGMAVAALVAGNSVALKSAEQTPLVSQMLVDLLHEAGVPSDVLIHLPGLGEEVGAVLVNSPKVAGIVFTGSKNVGMMIAHKAGKRVVRNERYKIDLPVKAITEMGGKNCIIVTQNAELDETVSGILASAYGHAGQKCSACSRVLVHSFVKERLVERLREASIDLEIGESFKFQTTMNPVISSEDKERIKKAAKDAGIEAARYGGKVHLDRTLDDLPGFCVGPAIIEVPKTRAISSESFATKEIFGPVIHIIEFDTLDEAIKIFNSVEYALTGGVFSQSQDDIDYLVSNLESGNIYINRTITGARVAIEPFGGFKLSGTGPKAGGDSYLRSFHYVPHATVNIKIKEEQGTSYRFDLCRESRLSPSSRAIRVEHAIDNLVRHFEVVFQGLFGDEKDMLRSFRDWVKRDLVSFLSNNHLNRVIPGQHSYNDFMMMRSHTLVASFSVRPPFEIFMLVISAMATGSGITVMSRNEESYRWWMSVRDLFIQGGISKENFDVFFTSESVLDQTLEDPMWESLILDGTMSEYKKISAKVYNERYKEKHMRKIFSLFDMPNVNNFKRACEEFVRVRSLAINTMRHGAPLSLDL